MSENCKCIRLAEVEKERDALKAEIKKIIAIVENRNDLFEMVADLTDLFEGIPVISQPDNERYGSLKAVLVDPWIFTPLDISDKSQKLDISDISAPEKEAEHE